MIDPETPGSDDLNYPDDWFDEALARCEADPALDVISELRKGAKNPALFDDMEQRREELYATMRQAFADPAYIRGAPETVEAIVQYHQKVVIPIMVKFVHQILAVQAELAIHRAQLSSDQ